MRRNSDDRQKLQEVTTRDVTHDTPTMLGAQGWDGRQQ